MVTAGALQSVHRLAEGMIAAAAVPTAEAKWHDRTDHSPGGASPASEFRGGGVPGIAGREMGQQTASSRGGSGEAENIDARQQPPTRLADGTTARTQGPADRASFTEEAGPNGVANADGGDADDAGSLVESLVATTAKEYIEKAVAVAAPGALKESVRRALCRGRDGMLHGDGDSVVTDWERFLKNAAKSATSSA